MAGRISDAEHALRSALGNLWALNELADEATRLEGPKAGLAVWLRNTADVTRWVMVASSAGRGGDLPAQLLRNRAFFNAHGFKIPDAKGSEEKWRL